VLVVGGIGSVSDTILSSAETFDPSANTWTSTGSMAVARRSHTATLLPDGRVVVAGGEGLGGARLASAELYDPASGTWSAADSMATGRFLHTATLLPHGRVLVAGGITSAGPGTDLIIDTAEIYRAHRHGTGDWRLTDSLNEPRALHAATALPSGDVLVVGGVQSGVVLASAELFRP
jgi:N-acetylneuraminic acid mutarotase